MSNALGRNMATTIKGRTIVCKAMSKSLGERIDLVEEVIGNVSSVNSATSVDQQILKQLCESSKEFAEHADIVASEAARYAQAARIAAEKLERLSAS